MMRVFFSITLITLMFVGGCASEEGKGKNASFRITFSEYGSINKGYKGFREGPIVEIESRRSAQTLELKEGVIRAKLKDGSFSDLDAFVFIKIGNVKATGDGEITEYIPKDNSFKANAIVFFVNDRSVYTFNFKRREKVILGLLFKESTSAGDVTHIKIK